MDTTTFEPEETDNFPQQDFHAQMIQMKIAEQPEETLKEENFRNSSQRSIKGDKLSKTFSKEKSESIDSTQGESTLMKTSAFDRMLLMQSDDLLQDVSELINEIKSSEANKRGIRNNADSNEDASEFNDTCAQEVVDPSFERQNSSIQEKLDSIEGRFCSLELSGIELSDITCPQNVMEQSVPNSSRLERSFSAVLGKPDVGNVPHNFTLIECDNDNSQKNDFSNSNNLFSSKSDALALQVSARAASPADANSTYGIDQEEIQRKICSALRLLEEEEQKINGDMRDTSLRSGARSQSPLVSVSLPDSRPESQVQSCKSSPRLRSEERSIMYQHRPTSKGIFDAGAFTTQSHHHQENGPNVHVLNDGSRSARSCSCIADHRSSESLNSARSSKTTVGNLASSGNNVPSRLPRPDSGGEEMWNTTDNKTKQIFSFLDEVEKSDQEILFGLRFDSDGLGRPRPSTSSICGASKDLKSSGLATTTRQPTGEEKQFRTMDCLIRKGSVELSREILLLERKLDEAHHAVKLLEESLLNQRELNIRNLRNSERDFKKRIRMQKEEFDVAFSRNEALINEMVAEKRVLQEKLDKLIKNFEEMEERHKEQIKSMQQKHLDEIRRLRKMQQNAESSLKQKLAGNKAQANEIREMTVKGLEPEVQRIIQRHQQEMSEMRAWHADEIRETEERYQRKLHMQLEDMREKFAKEKEDIISRERDLANRRLDVELKQKEDEIENLKRRLTNEIFEERERAVSEEVRLKETMQEAVRKAQIKGEVELENLKQEHTTKLANLERKHESELKSLTDVFEAEKQNWASNQNRKLEHSLADQEGKLRETFQDEKDREWREKEKKLKEEFEKFRKDDEHATEARFRRMQEKLQSELEEMEKSERDLKSKFSQTKSDLIAREEEIFSMKTSLTLKDKQMNDLQEINMKMQEERVNLTSVIRREFVDQIQAIEEECRSLKSSIVEIQSNSKLHVEQKQLEIEKVIAEKDAEIEKIGLRVKQALARKDETIAELQKQFEKSSYQISHLEELLEEQRKEFLHGMKLQSSSTAGARKK
ncbi:hypothetical protein Ocin01_14118 [Orchesella cincta]|uniref:5-azacytidine-induced protein 1 n=1 Tax=Orchesella cincta TaxID=48709 RepID=A0A1D2MI15_ORCCI|nr:hypothetical protein Ocin01_14118 [Orchesella cincta]